MKRFLHFLPLVALVVASWWLTSSSKKGILGVYYSSGVTGSGMDRTGSPLSSGSTCSQCHGGGSYNPSVVVDVKNGSGVSVTTYTPGQTYTVNYTFTVGSGSPIGFGFQSVALTNSNANGGNFSSALTPSTKLTVLNNRKYFEHAQTLGVSTVSATWVAPAAGTGNITFYTVINAVNGNGSTSGDHGSPSVQKVLTEFVPTTIAYSSAQYCKNSSNPSPTISGNQGGSFGASPAGLSINSSNGVVNLGTSTPGQYSISYTHSGGIASTTLKVNPTYNLSNNATICSNDSIFLAGAYRKTPGTYTSNLTSVNGCDSIVTTNLTVNQAYQFNNVASICSGDSILLYGVYRKIAGVYVNGFTTNKGCDSVYSTQLTVHQKYQIDTTMTICQGDSVLLFGGYYKSPGNVIDSAQTALGCDSITNVQLNVMPLDLTVSVSGNTLTALQSGANYQWLDCDNGFQAVLGATQQSFTPSANGNYACEITNGTCTKRSSCYSVNSVTLDEIPFEVKLSPNPSNGTIQLTLANSSPGFSLDIIDLQGRSLFNQILDSDRNLLFDVSGFTKGTYFIRITGKGKTSLVKWVLE